MSNSTTAPACDPTAFEAPRASTVVDAAYVVARLEEAGHTLLCLPQTGPSTRLRSSALEVLRSACAEEESVGQRLRIPVPSAGRIGRMDEAWDWLGLIPADRYVLRRIVGARALVSPATERHLFSWRRLGGLLGADHRAIQRWHREGIGWIVAGLTGAPLVRCVGKRTARSA